MNCFSDRSGSLFTGSMILIIIWGITAGFARLSLLPVIPHGDEPHYLIMTLSFLKEGDVNLADNYARRDYAEFTNMTLTPHRTTFDDQKLYSNHMPGLPILMVLPYWLWGRTGCTIFMTFLASLASLQIYLWSRQWGISKTGAIWGTATVTLTLPWIMISGMIFPAIPAALCFISALRLYSVNRKTGSDVFATALVSLLPFFHIKYSLLSAGAFLYYISVRKPGRKTFLISLLPVCVGTAAFAYFQQAIYGDWLYLVKLQASGFQNPLRGIAGMLFDRETGLMTYSPIYLLAIAGFFHMKEHKTAMWGIAGIAVAYVIISGSWTVWHSGHAPPARYLVPLLPILGLGSAGFWDRSKWKVRILAGIPLLGISLLHVFLVLVSIPETVIVVGDGRHRLYEMFSVPLGTIYPSLLNPKPGTGWTLAGWIGLLLLILAAATVDREHAARFQRTRYIAGLAIGLATAVSLTWGAYHEYHYREHIRAMQLSSEKPELISPGNGAVFSTSMPALSWSEVGGADGYLWKVRFPNDEEYGTEIFGQTTVKLPDSVLFAIPDGTYTWWVIPLKNGRHGQRSEPHVFVIDKSKTTLEINPSGE